MARALPPAPMPTGPDRRPGAHTTCAPGRPHSAVTAQDRGTALPQHPAFRYYLPSVLNEDLQSVRSSLVDAKNSFFGKTRKSERALGALAAHRTAVPMPQNGAELLAVVDELIRLATRRDALSRCRTSLLPEEAAWSGQWTPFDRSACQGAIGALDLGLVHASLELQGARGAFNSFSSDHQYEYVRSYARTLDEIRSLLPPGPRLRCAGGACSHRARGKSPNGHAASRT